LAEKADSVEQKAKALLIDASDNVAVALQDIPAGASVEILGTEGQSVRVESPVPFAHKIAITPIKGGDTILKYGVPIGFATVVIAAGEWVHEHNAKSYYAARREGNAR
jgi:predicted RecA/RadA family phage recombinase